MSLCMPRYLARSYTSLVGQRRSQVDRLGLKGLASTPASNNLEVRGILELLGVAVVDLILELLLLQVVVMTALQL